MNNTTTNNLSKLSIIIPAYNEKKGIALVLQDLVDSFTGSEIIVVDDGSNDGTQDEILKYPQITCLSHNFNIGYGAALKTGMRYATREYVAWFDADGQHKAEDLLIILNRIVSEKKASIIAQRKKMGPSPVRKWGKWIIGSLARSFNVEIGPDINCGLRIFRRDVISKYLSILPDGFSASITSTMVMLERGYPISFHPIETLPDITPSKVKFSDGFFAIILVLRTTMLFAPLRIFLRFGIVLILSGLLYGIVMLYFQRQGVPAAANLVIIVGVLIGIFGLLADQISQMRLSQYESFNFDVINNPTKPVISEKPSDIDNSI